MKFKSIFIKFLILAVIITGAFALSSCFTGSALLLGSCVACNQNCGNANGDERLAGVEYTLEDDGESYYVSQLPSNGAVEILSEYKGKPVTRISAYAFEQCYLTGCGYEYGSTKLQRLTLPASITEVSGGVGSSTTIYEINYLGSMSDWCNLRGGSGLFTGSTRLMIDGKLVTEFTAPEDCTRVPDSLFEDYGYLSEVTLPSGVTAIGEAAFKDCKRLQTVNIAGVIDDIGAHCFSGCVKLEGVDLANAAVECIREYTFADCVSFCTFTIPETVELIDKHAFVGCKIYEVYNLSELTFDDGNANSVTANAIVVHTSLDEPSAIFSDGDFRFVRGEEVYLCAYFGSESRLDLPQSTELGEYRICDKLFARTYLNAVNIPANCVAIGNSAFLGCSSLAEVTGGSGVKTIGVSAFGNCRSLTGAKFANVENIEANAFSGCESLADIKFGSALKTVGESAFVATSALISINLTADKIGGYAFANSGVVYAELFVREIGHYAFKNCKYLSEVILHEGLEIVGTDAFMYCVSLTKLEIPSTVTEFGGQSGLKMLEQISVAEGNENYISTGNCLIERESKTLVCGCKNSSIPDDGSVEIIGSYAFEGCEIENVYLPESVKEVGYAAFRDSSLQSINFDSLQRIDSYAFYGCEGLKKIVIPDSVTHLGNGAFEKCINLAEVELSKSLTRINHSAFYLCESLLRIEIPEGVRDIESMAFYGCGSLYEVVFPATLRMIKSNAFYCCESLAHVTLPENASYESHTFPETTVIEYEKAAVE